MKNRLPARTQSDSKIMQITKMNSRLADLTAR